MVLLKINAMLICNNLKLETIQMSNNRGMARQMYVHAGILLSDKKEQTINTHNETDESQKHTGVKETREERDCTVRFHVCKILENTNQP